MLAWDPTQRPTMRAVLTCVWTDACVEARSPFAAEASDGCTSYVRRSPLFSSLRDDGATDAQATRCVSYDAYKRESANAPLPDV
jgi:hypothetical protein